jgi:hypothetical protein
MELWMDISRNDKGEVNSVVVGCESDALRAVYHTTAEANSWLNRHHRDFHPQGSSSAVTQIGCPAGGTPIASVLQALLSESGKPMSTHVLADAAGKKYNHTFVALKRLHKAGKVEKVKTGNFTHWKAAA